MVFLTCYCIISSFTISRVDLDLHLTESSKIERFTSNFIQTHFQEFLNLNKTTYIQLFNHQLKSATNI